MVSDMDWVFSPSRQGESEVDVIAEQLKFRACLKILMTELRTLATGYEVDGGKLRFQLYNWLEKEIGAMHKICNYKVCSTVALHKKMDEMKTPVKVTMYVYSSTVLQYKFKVLVRTLLKYLSFLLRHTSIPLHLRGKCCTFWSTTCIWQL